MQADNGFSTDADFKKKKKNNQLVVIRCALEKSCSLENHKREPVSDSDGATGAHRS
jgi:hypothetical protein